MIDQSVKARVNLYGLFKALELLAQVDKEAAAAIAGRRLAIEFRVRGVGRARLHLNDGQVRLQPPCGRESDGGRMDGGADIILWFKGPEHFNAMIDGRGQPIPLKGFGHLKFLTGPFQVFMGRLAHYLLPTPELLQDPEFFAANTRMTAYVAFHALSEIANYDEEGMHSAHYIPDGILQVEVVDDIALYMVCQGGRLATYPGRHESPRCVLWFADIAALNDLLTGRVHTFDAVALGRMGMNGFVPMIDYLNPVLGRLPAYLK